MCRLLLSLSLVFALTVICPIRCQADAARALGGATAESEGCPCCPSEGEDNGPGEPIGEDCIDCVCDGAVDGPKVPAVELPPALPGDLPAATASVGRLSACASECPDGRPDAPDGAKLRLLMGSLVV